jgi:hypothetical protein
LEWFKWEEPRQVNLRFLWVLLVIILFVLMNSEVVLAQDGAPSWSIPENISNTASDSAYPTIAADSYGTVHVFWTENLNEYGPFNNIIYYARIKIPGRSQSISSLLPKGCRPWLINQLW